ncbi:MAG: hypothetical protein GY755_23210 [Chloroflexi bacterium]|nr:hypothetical protein [Chloroflexota bacterium]
MASITCLVSPQRPMDRYGEILMEALDAYNAELNWLELEGRLALLSAARNCKRYDSHAA